MAGIAVHPVEADNEQEHDVLSVELALRIQVLDLATGRPLKNALVSSPTMSPEVISKQPGHAMRVLKTRKVEFTNDSTGTFSIKSHTLRTFELKEEKMHATWQCVPEIFRTKEDGAVYIDDNGNVFQQVEADLERYVCIKSADTDYCEPVLATNEDGVLDLPVSYLDWATGDVIQFVLRDYVLAEAAGAYAVDSHDTLKALLLGDPVGNAWFLQSGASIVHCFPFHLIHLNYENLAEHLWDAYQGDTEPDVVLWAIRKARTCTSDAKTKTNDRPSTATVRGIVIHYNSGHYVEEKRGAGTALCREVFEADYAKSLHEDNQHYSNPELCLHILKKLFSSGKTGYHYHIDRNGEILFVADEAKRVYHSGSSREPDSISAERDGVDDVSHSFTAPTEKLDNTHIGINLTGHHSAATYYFTDEQVWYLDRLIENIQSRREDVEWHSILGHDEVRAAYKAAHPGSSAHDKADPGAALAGGMARLRGRHGAPFEEA